MHTSKNRNSIEAGSLPIESVDNISVISPVALVHTHHSKTGYRNSPISSSQMKSSSASTCSFLMAVYVSVSSKETACHLLAFGISIGALHLVLFFDASLVWINCNMNADWYISDILCPIIVPKLRSLPNIFQQDNATPHVAYCVLIFLDTQGIQLLLWPIRSLDLSPTENISSWAAERLAHHPSQIYAADEVRHRIEAAWNVLPISVIQAQFNSMPNRLF